MKLIIHFVLYVILIFLGSAFEKTNQVIEIPLYEKFLSEPVRASLNFSINAYH